MSTNEPNAATPGGSDQSNSLINTQQSAEERTCWICYGSDGDGITNPAAIWVQPCKCRGTLKWVHQKCLYRWIDEKQKNSSNATRPVVCPQCKTEYMIITPKFGRFAAGLESADIFIRRTSTFLAAGVVVGALYWSAVTYGAVTCLQIAGHKRGLALLGEGDFVTLLVGLPAIPVGLIFGRMIQWERALFTMMNSRCNIVRKLPLLNCIISCEENENENENGADGQPQRPSYPTNPSVYAEPISGTRVLCGALLLPTISIGFGALFYGSIQNSIQRALLGGLTFVGVKGLLKIYLMDQKLKRRNQRRVLEYTEENLQAYRNQQQQQPISSRLSLESSSFGLFSDGL